MSLPAVARRRPRGSASPTALLERALPGAAGHRAARPPRHPRRRAGPAVGWLRRPSAGLRLDEPGQDLPCRPAVARAAAGADRSPERVTTRAYRAGGQSGGHGGRPPAPGRGAPSLAMTDMTGRPPACEPPTSSSTTAASPPSTARSPRRRRSRCATAGSAPSAPTPRSSRLAGPGTRVIDAGGRRVHPRAERQPHPRHPRRAELQHGAALGRRALAGRRDGHAEARRPRARRRRNGCASSAA